LEYLNLARREKKMCVDDNGGDEIILDEKVKELFDNLSKFLAEINGAIDDIKNGD